MVKKPRLVHIEVTRGPRRRSGPTQVWRLRRGAGGESWGATGNIIWEVTYPRVRHERDRLTYIAAALSAARSHQVRVVRIFDGPRGGEPLPAHFTGGA